MRNISLSRPLQKLTNNLTNCYCDKFKTDEVGSDSVLGDGKFRRYFSTYK